MRLQDVLLTMALIALSSGAALAQSASPAESGALRSHWVASGFVGANLDTIAHDSGDTDVAGIDGPATLDFGGQCAYLWRDMLGMEGVVAVARKMSTAGTLFADKPSIYTYMANAIGAARFGEAARYLPYVSGGFGAIQLLADVSNTFDQPLDGATRSNRTTFGGNVGGGIMAFAGHFGIRGDVRFYHAAADEAPPADTRAERVTQAALFGLSFWRANVGMAVRW